MRLLPPTIAGLVRLALASAPGVQASTATANVQYATDSASWQSGSTTVDSATTSWTVSGSTITLSTTTDSFVSIGTPSPPTCKVDVSQNDVLTATLSCSVNRQRVWFNAPVWTHQLVAHRVTVSALWLAGYAEAGYGNSNVIFHHTIDVNGGNVHDHSNNLTIPNRYTESYRPTIFDCPATIDFRTAIRTVQDYVLVSEKTDQFACT